MPITHFNDDTIKYLGGFRTQRDLDLNNQQTQFTLSGRRMIVNFFHARTMYTNDKKCPVQRHDDVALIRTRIYKRHTSTRISL